MSDKELLELAAKAMGKTAWWSPSLEDWQKDLTPPYVDAVVWDPLTDDGDALRLAVILDISISLVAGAGSVMVSGAGGVLCEQGSGNESVRRAIVRAAATIGEKMS